MSVNSVGLKDGGELVDGLARSRSSSVSGRDRPLACAVRRIASVTVLGWNSASSTVHSRSRSSRDPPRPPRRWRSSEPLLLGDRVGAQLDRRDGFEEGVQRSAERAGLLPGDDRDRRRIAELRRGGTGLGRRVARRLLRGDDRGDRRGSRGDDPATRAIAVAPRLRPLGLPAYSDCDRSEVVGVFARQGADPREAPDVHAGTRGAVGRSAARGPPWWARQTRWSYSLRALRKHVKTDCAIGCARGASIPRASAHPYMTADGDLCYIFSTRAEESRH